MGEGTGSILLCWVFGADLSKRRSGTDVSDLTAATDPNGRRQTVRLGKANANATANVRNRIEQLLVAKITGTPIDRDLASWLGELEDALRNRLAAVGLCDARGSALLESFIKPYVEGRADVKPATKEIWKQGHNGLIEFFGANRPLRNITPGDADRYKLKLVADVLASMTVRKRLQFATMIFRAAVRRRLPPSADCREPFRRHIDSSDYAEQRAVCDAQRDRVNLG